jgi:hypothetical protein
LKPWFLLGKKVAPTAGSERLPFVLRSSSRGGSQFPSALEVVWWNTGFFPQLEGIFTRSPAVRLLLSRANSTIFVASVMNTGRPEGLSGIFAKWKVYSEKV